MLGFAEGAFSPGGLKVVSEWFPAKERGLAGGLYNIGPSIGSMIAPHTMRGDIKSPADGAKANAKLRELLFFDLLAHGIFMMPKRCLIALSLPLTDKDFDTFAGAVEEVISARRSLLQ